MRETFASMLAAGASIAVAGKLRSGLNERVHELSSPLLRDGA